MSRAEILAGVAAECCAPRADERMRELLIDAFEAIFGESPPWANEGGNDAYINYRHLRGPFERMIALDAYESAAMRLQGDLVWLCPEIIYHERKVRLVNGLGRPVADGDAHESHAANTVLALVAAWLKAHARKARFEEKEVEG